MKREGACLFKKARGKKVGVVRKEEGIEMNSMCSGDRILVLNRETGNTYAEIEGERGETLRRQRSATVTADGE